METIGSRAVAAWFVCAMVSLSISAASAAGIDCSKARTIVEKTICSDAVLADLDRRVSTAYQAALDSPLSDEGRIALRDEQRHWLKRVRTTCEIPPPRKAFQPTAKGCLQEEYGPREKQLETAVQTFGSITIRRVGVYRVLTSKDDTGPDARPGTLEVSYPQIDAPKTPSERAFNGKLRALVQASVSVYDADGGATDVNVNYDSAAFTRDLISVDIETYTYSHGMPHGQDGHTIIHWLVASARMLKASDVFAENTKWQSLLQNACFREVAQYGFIHTAADLKGSVEEPGAWSFARDGLSVNFGQYAVASYADGEPSVTIPWAALKPYLKQPALQLWR